MQRPTVAIHGGAGDLARYSATHRLQEAEHVLSQIIDSAYTNLLRGATALDVVEQAVVTMEDSGLFHAGKGSSPTSSGPELDASIMSGADMNAGAVTLVSTVKNPIRLARIVMEKTPHVLVASSAAEQLARNHNLTLVNEEYYVPCDTSAFSQSTGTVGAVARDVTGCFAAATSTGGTLRKATGRIGDSPIIGSGTYARNNVGAVSCTGYGEYFIRVSAAATVIMRMELLGESVGTAAGYVLGQVQSLGGEGGLIAIGPRGDVSMPFNTTGMYRAFIDSHGNRSVKSLA